MTKPDRIYGSTKTKPDRIYGSTKTKPDRIYGSDKTKPDRFYGQDKANESFFGGFMGNKKWERKAPEFENYSAWDKMDRILVKNGKLTDQQIKFLYVNLKNNIEHARHVESERLSFNSIFLTVAAATLAFVKDFSSPVSALLLLAVAIEGAIAITLTWNWGNVFDTHWQYAAGCYRVLHHALIDMDGEPAGGLISDEEMEIKLAELYGDNSVFETFRDETVDRVSVHPFFSFRIQKLRTKNPLTKKRTRTLFTIFYGVIEAALILAFVISVVECCRA